MSYNPMEGFQVGQAIGKSKRSAFGSTTEHLSELAKERDKEGVGMDKVLQSVMLKQALTSPLQQSQIDLNDAKMTRLKDPSKNLSAFQQIKKDKRVEDLFMQMETNKIKKQSIDKAITSLPNIPSGLVGKFQVGLMKQFKPNDPILSDWQNLKSVLMDATLLNIGKTKGAISDREMTEFQTAAANDDLVSVSRMGNALQRLRDSIEAQEKASMASYQTIYNENPNQFLGTSDDIAMEDDGGGMMDDDDPMGLFS